MKIKRRDLPDRSGNGQEFLSYRVESESGIHGWGEAYVTPARSQSSSAPAA